MIQEDFDLIWEMYIQCLQGVRTYILSIWSGTDWEIGTGACEFDIVFPLDGIIIGSDSNTNCVTISKLYLNV